MKQNLNDLLSLNNDNNIYVLHSAPACYPYVVFLLDRLQKNLSNTTKYQFQVDRYFKFNDIDNILDNGSLFAEQNIIELNFKTKPLMNQEEELLKLINRIDDNSFLFITTDKLTSTSSKWLKKIDEVGIIVGVNETDTGIIVRNLLQTAKLTIDNTAMSLLLELNAGNIPELMQEINRLTFLCPENHTITINDIQSSDNAQYNIYELSNAYLAGDIHKSRKILDNIYHESADAILIMWMINEDIKKLLKIKAKLKDNININTAIGELRVWGDTINNLKIASNRVSYNSLLEILDKLANLDMSIKGVYNTPPQTILVKILEVLCLK